MATKKKPTVNVDETSGKIINPEALLDKAIASGLEVGVEDIDDSDIPKAPNVLIWLTSPRYLNVRPYAKQLEDALLIFGDWCPFCSDVPYLMDIPIDAKIGDIKDHSSLLKYGRCPRCRRGKLEMRVEWLADPINMGNWGHRYKIDPPNDVALLEGQRSGKSVKTAMYTTYVLHRYLKLPNPGRWFGLLRNVGALYGTFVSVTAGQAESNLWQPFSDMIDASPWFQQYHKFLSEKGRAMGVELFTKLDTYIWYQHKRLGISYAPADQRSLRGKTRLFASVDELSWLIAGGGRGQAQRGVGNIKINADGVVRALDRSLASIRLAASKKRKLPGLKAQDTPDAYMINISSPSSALDPMVRRIRRGEKSPRMYCVTRPTWKANPNYTESTLRAQEGDVSEIEFMCDFGCVPPYSDSPWWDNKPELLNLCASAKTDVSLWKGQHEYLSDETGEALRWIYYRLDQISTDRYSTRVLSFDTGEKACSFSWAVERYDRMTDSVVIEDVGEIAPGAHEQIHHGLMWEFVIERLVQNFRFLHVVWDRWNSSRYVADLRTKYKVRAEQFTATSKDGRAMRSDLKNGKIVFPRPEVDLDTLPIGNNVELSRHPRAHLLLQVLTVRDNAGLPLKPQGGNDDTFRAALLGHAYIRNNQEMYQSGQRFSGPRSIGVGVGGRVMGGGGYSGIITGQGGRGIAVGPRGR